MRARSASCARRTRVSCSRVAASASARDTARRRERLPHHTPSAAPPTTMPMNATLCAARNAKTRCTSAPVDAAQIANDSRCAALTPRTARAVRPRDRRAANRNSAIATGSCIPVSQRGMPRRKASARYAVRHPPTPTAGHLALTARLDAWTAHPIRMTATTAANGSGRFQASGPSAASATGFDSTWIATAPKTMPPKTIGARRLASTPARRSSDRTGGGASIGTSGTATPCGRRTDRVDMRVPSEHGHAPTAGRDEFNRSVIRSDEVLPSPPGGVGVRG
ncbi:hypothetical protein SRABI128_02146 [Microbacterium sp. Bi128]|nr:hypothetical protein SRABI128_02146 [Microbacterium sp. Bi128]